jgi:hypothetical protein
MTPKDTIWENNNLDSIIVSPQENFLEKSKQKILDKYKLSSSHDIIDLTKTLNIITNIPILQDKLDNIVNKLASFHSSDIFTLNTLYSSLVTQLSNSNNEELIDDFSNNPILYIDKLFWDIYTILLLQNITISHAFHTHLLYRNICLYLFDENLILLGQGVVWFYREIAHEDLPLIKGDRGICFVEI